MYKCVLIRYIESYLFFVNNLTLYLFDQLQNLLNNLYKLLPTFFNNQSICDNNNIYIKNYNIHIGK
jgi:hypothetical protein